jgi:type I restriction enzyme M protein
MANSASDARGSELEIRRQLIEERAVDVMVAIGSNFFYTVTLPCTLWFFDKGKKGHPQGRPGAVHRRPPHLPPDRPRPPRLDPGPDRVPGQHRPPLPGREPEDLHGSAELLAEQFPDLEYADVPGLCNVASCHLGRRSKSRAGA